MLVELWEYANPVVLYWAAGLSGGVVIAAIWVYEHRRERGIPWRLVKAYIALSFVIATFSLGEINM